MRLTVLLLFFFYPLLVLELAAFFFSSFTPCCLLIYTITIAFIGDFGPVLSAWTLHHRYQSRGVSSDSILQHTSIPQKCTVSGKNLLISTKKFSINLIKKGLMVEKIRQLGVRL